MKTTLKEKREALNLTQKNVADVLGISSQAYGHYENLKRRVPIEHIIPLATVLKMGVEEFVVMMVELYN